MLLYIGIVVWLACGWVYYRTVENGQFAPSDMNVVCGYYNNCAPGAVEKSAEQKPNWIKGSALPPEYTDFHPFVYSLNVLVPVLDLQQESAWAPMPEKGKRLCTNLGGILQILVWIETIYGWLAGVMLLTVLSGLTRKQEEE